MPGIATVPRSPEPRPPLAATLRDRTPVRMRDASTELDRVDGARARAASSVSAS